MKKLIFVEGLWSTGKSYFVNHVKSLLKAEDKVIIYDSVTLRDLESIRHSAYTIYPRVYKKDMMFDRSPVTLRVISDRDIGIYKNPSVSPDYWERYYSEWVESLKELERDITFIYFRPFDSMGHIHDDVLKYVINYKKSDLMIDLDKLDEKRLTWVHEKTCKEINTLYKNLKPNFDFYQVEFKDTQDAVEVLQYEQFLPSLGKYQENLNHLRSI